MKGLGKAAALGFFEAFWRADLGTAMGFLAPGARFLMMPTVADQRDNDAREALRRIINTMFIAFDEREGLRCEVTTLIEEGSEVAMEYIARAKTVNGEQYENFYSAHLTVVEGKITVLRTYADTQYLTAKLMS
jgi:ketosteroid isomerase-like protein